MLPRQSRLTKAEEFSRIYKAGRRFSSPHLRFFNLPADQNPTRFGFVVSKKQVLRIADRNRVKRILRAQVRALLPKIKPGFQIIILAKPGIGTTPREELVRELSFGLEKLGVING